MKYRCRGGYYPPKLILKTIDKYRLEIPSIYEYVILQDFIIMPNHIHAIILIDEETNKAIDNRPYGLLSKIIKWFKQTTAKQLHQAWLKNFRRQRSFYDHVIRNKQDLFRIQEYIILNPYKRKNDEYYL